MINNDTYQRETLSERPIRQPLIALSYYSYFGPFSQKKKKEACLFP